MPSSLAEELQIPEVIVPPAPGAFSALGLVATDLKRDYSRTLYADLGSMDPARVAEVIAGMEQAGQRDAACRARAAGATARCCARRMCAIAGRPTS